MSRFVIYIDENGKKKVKISGKQLKEEEERKKKDKEEVKKKEKKNMTKDKIQITFEELKNFEGKSIYHIKANNDPFIVIHPGVANRMKSFDKLIFLNKDNEEVIRIKKEIEI